MHNRACTGATQPSSRAAKGAVFETRNLDRRYEAWDVCQAGSDEAVRFSCLNTVLSILPRSSLSSPEHQRYGARTTGTMV